ncbi:MAG: FAD binding domain-containing protein [Deltaproteobacteria bacterium]|nr:FAD binding domain-containing protein [Deltaproteobacteria bacterium]
MPALRQFAHVAATSIPEAVRLCAGRGKKAAIVAGGTDLLGVLKDGIHPGYPDVLVDIKPIAALRGVKDDRRGLRIGALTTLREIAGHKVVNELYPVLAQAARAVASPQIRNMGTIGGNLCQEPRCWYYRTPDNLFNCLRKGGDRCGAVLGENRYHSIFGAARTAIPGCAKNCPAHVRIPLYLEKIRRGEIDAAARLILESNPMPAITGRVCPHFCQSHCIRRGFDEAVSTRAVERRLGDHVLAHAATFMRPPARETGKRVAVVGAGPGGLAAACFLRRAGHLVTVFDKMPEAGGMLRYCIPAYRLPKEVVRRQVQAFARMGIKFERGVEIGGKKATLAGLRKGFDFVFLATGAWRQKTLGIEHEELMRPGLDFLVDVSRGRREAPGQKVLVIGGGSVAVDVALSARRLGAREVTMACLETRDAMPALPEELEMAIEEKVEILPSWGPHRVLCRDGSLTGIELVRCTSVFDREGRFRPVFDPSVKKTVNADCVLLAIGQGADLAYAGRSLAVRGGVIAADKDTQATNLPDVFAGGEAVTGASTVIAAIAAGRRAALAIDAALRGGRAAAATAAPGAAETRVDVNVEALVETKAIQATVRAPLARAIDAEDVSGVDLRAVEAESRRCLNCGCVAVNASDLAPALLALDATIKTTRRTIAAGDFFGAGLMTTTALAPDEIVTEIRIPVPPPGNVQGYQKFRIRNSIDFPIVGVATVFTLKGTTIKDARVVLGAVAPVPLRAREVERFLAGKTLCEETAEAAGTIAVRGVQPLGGNKFKIQIVKALLKKAILGSAA